jgi:hypothetical protein
MAKNKFPILWTLLLIFGIIWFVNETFYVNINLPWLPIILIVIAIGMIANRYK